MTAAPALNRCMRLAATLAAAVAVTGLSARAAPSEFHVWDGPLTAAPGAVLRSEALPDAMRLDGAEEQLRILYSSTGFEGAPIVVSGMLFVPAGEPPARGWPLVSWAHGTVGIADACAPSVAGPGEASAAYIERWLAAGHAVVATDYEGLGTAGPHPYLVKLSEGRSVLDAARAAMAANREITGPLIVAGQSQGGGAAFAAGGLAASYAPELEIDGVVATGAPYLTAEMPTASGAAADTVDPGLAYVFYAAHVAQVMDASLDPASLFTDRAMPVFEAAASECIGTLMSAVRDAGLSQANALKAGAVETLLPVLLPHYSYPTLALSAPLFLGTGTADRDVDPRGQFLLLRDACAGGTTVAAHIYEGANHTGAWRASWDDQMAFAEAVGAGERIGSDCPR